MGWSTRTAKKLNLLRLNGNICALCGEKIIGINHISADHVIPKQRFKRLKQEEKDVYSNYKVVITHYFCNNYRSDKSFVKTALNLEGYRRAIGPRFLELINEETDSLGQFSNINTDQLLKEMKEVNVKNIEDLEQFIKLRGLHK